MVAIAVVAGIVGAKLWHVLDTPSEFREIGWRVLWDSAGFAWFGGLVFGIAALVMQGWRAKIGALRMLDLAAPAAAVGYGIGRIGCFLSGDGDYGIATKLPWGMSFPNGLEPDSPGVRVHPTPLYELAAGLLIGGWLWVRGRKPADRLDSGRISGADRDRALPGGVHSAQSQGALGLIQCAIRQCRLGSRRSGTNLVGRNAHRHRARRC